MTNDGKIQSKDIVRRQEKTTRHIVRSPQREIRNRTGMTVSLMFNHSGTDNLKTPEAMMQVIAIALDMHTGYYKKRSRARDVVELRFIAAQLMRVYFPYITLQQIASLFGGQDHTSIINGIARAHSLIYIGDAGFTRKHDLAVKAVNLWLEKTGRVAA